MNRLLIPPRAFWIVLGVVALLALLTGDTSRRPAHVNVLYACLLVCGWYLATVAVCIPVVLLRQWNRRKFWKRVQENAARHEARRPQRAEYRDTWSGPVPHFEMRSPAPPPPSRKGAK